MPRVFGTWCQWNKQQTIKCVFLISAVCVYKGKQYKQGQKWQDGCAYDCECVDGSMGQFQCTDKYVVNKRDINNVVNINETNNHHVIHWILNRSKHMTLEILVLAWDRFKNVAGLNWIVGSNHDLDNGIQACEDINKSIH